MAEGVFSGVDNIIECIHLHCIGIRWLIEYLDVQSSIGMKKK